MIRKANVQDIPKITAIFDQLHTEEELGHSTTGWLRGIYPTEDVAAAGVRAGDMIVVEEDGEVCAAARINQEQCEEYAQITWEFEAREEQVLVLHTLVVSPRTGSKGPKLHGSSNRYQFPQSAGQSHVPKIRLSGIRCRGL